MAGGSSPWNDRAVLTAELDWTLAAASVQAGLRRAFCWIGCLRDVSSLADSRALFQPPPPQPPVEIERLERHVRTARSQLGRVVVEPEQRLLERLLYRNKSQLLRSDSFQRLRKVLKLLRRWRELDLVGQMQILRRHVPKPAAAATAAATATAVAATGEVKAAALPTAATLAAVLLRLQGGGALLQALAAACEEAFAAASQRVAKSLFLPFHVTVAALLSRLAVKAQYLRKTICRAYDTLVPVLAWSRVPPGPTGADAFGLPVSLDGWLTKETEGAGQSADESGGLLVKNMVAAAPAARFDSAPARVGSLAAARATAERRRAQPIDDLLGMMEVPTAAAASSDEEEQQEHEEHNAGSHDSSSPPAGKKGAANANRAPALQKARTAAGSLGKRAADEDDEDDEAEMRRHKKRLALASAAAKPCSGPEGVNVTADRDTQKPKKSKKKNKKKKSAVVATVDDEINAIFGDFA